jgi:hypothetical protein
MSGAYSCFGNFLVVDEVQQQFSLISSYLKSYYPGLCLHFLDPVQRGCNFISGNGF